MIQGQGVFAGVAGAYPRALYRSMGFTDADFQKPLIGIVNSWSEVNPGHFHLRALAEWVKEGVRAAGGAPAEFNTVAPCDGILQGAGMYASLPLRDVIAASVELMCLGNRFAGVVMLCSCDKIVPAMLMAAARLDLPTLFVTGGPMAPGRVTDAQGVRQPVILSDVKEAMGRYKAGSISEQEFYEIECQACGGPGACAFMGTANSMNFVVETLGLSLPLCASMPALDPERAELCRASGRRIVELVRQDVRAGQMLGQASLENAVRMCLALGGSTNAVLHLPALASECGAEITPDTFDRLGGETPLIARFAPAGRLTIGDLHEAGGIPAALSVLAPLLDTSVPTVSGRTLGEIAAGAHVLRDDVLHPLAAPLAPQGGIAVLYGNLAPLGAVVKQSAVSPAMLRHRGPARVFESEDEVRESLMARGIRAGDVLVIRNEGPAGGPGMRELSIPAAMLVGLGLGELGGDDHRRPLFGRDARAVHRPRQPRSIRRRPDRRSARGRPDRDRHPGQAPGAAGGRRGDRAPPGGARGSLAGHYPRLPGALQPVGAGGRAGRRAAGAAARVGERRGLAARKLNGASHLTHDRLSGELSRVRGRPSR